MHGQIYVRTAANAEREYAYDLGARLYLDMKHVYYGIWQNQYVQAHEFLYKNASKFQAHAQLLGLHWDLHRGSLPRCSLSSVWALCSCAVSGRTIKKNKSAMCTDSWHLCGILAATRGRCPMLLFL